MRVNRSRSQNVIENLTNPKRRKSYWYWRWGRTERIIIYEWIKQHHVWLLMEGSGWKKNPFREEKCFEI